MIGKLSGGLRTVTNQVEKLLPGYQAAAIKPAFIVVVAVVFILVVIVVVDVPVVVVVVDIAGEGADEGLQAAWI